jgi:beta-mannanase
MKPLFSRNSWYVDYVRVYQRPEMATGSIGGGPVHVGDIRLEADETSGEWRAAAVITVHDAEGNPVEGITVTGGWVGIVTRGETSAQTDAQGMVRLLSNPVEKTGEITFCVTNMSGQNSTYDKSANLRNCAKLEKLLAGNSYSGRTTLITWEFMPGATKAVSGYEGRVLEAIIDGKYDDYLDSWARGMNDFGKPVLLRFGHEMNGDWYPWSGIFNGGGTLDGYGDSSVADGPERFVDAYRHIHDRFRQNGADKVLWVWCPNAPFSIMEDALGDWNNAAAYYPGDEYVDWMCFDGYNWGTSAFGQNFNAKWTSFDEIFANSYAELQAINPEKPIIIGEFSSTEEGGDKAAWITDTFQKIRTDYPQIRAIIWFHISKETDWRINSSDAALEAYRNAVSDDYWLSEWPGMKE